MTGILTNGDIDIHTRGKEDERGCDGWMASSTQWT